MCHIRAASSHDNGHSEESTLRLGVNLSFSLLLILSCYLLISIRKEGDLKAGVVVVSGRMPLKMSTSSFPEHVNMLGFMG